MAEPNPPSKHCSSKEIISENFDNSFIKPPGNGFILKKSFKLKSFNLFFSITFFAKWRSFPQVTTHFFPPFMIFENLFPN